MKQKNTDRTTVHADKQLIMAKKKERKETRHTDCKSKAVVFP